MELPGDAEIHHVGVGPVEQDVLRLDVAMEHSLLVRVLEGGRDPGGEG